MAPESAVEIRVGAPDSVLQIQAGRVRIDVPRSVGYFGGLALAVGTGLIQPSLGLFIAAVPVFKALTDSALPYAVRTVGEIYLGAAKPVGSDAEGVMRLEGQQRPEDKVVGVGQTQARA